MADTVRTFRKTAGITLVEVVTAIVVLGIAIPPVVGLFTEVAARGADDTYRRVAITYGNALLEEVVSKAFEDPDFPTGSFGTEEGTRLAYDDVDDYDGLNNSPPQFMEGTLLDQYSGFSRRVQVDNVTALDPDALVPEADGSTELKRIRVTVAWVGAAGGELTLSTLRSRLATTTAPTGPLDVPASVATATNTSRRRLELTLFNATTSDLEIESFALSADRPTPELRRFEMRTTGGWRRLWNGSEDLPTGVLELNQGSAAQRTIPASGTADVRLRFRNNISTGPITFTLIVNFTDGSSSTLVIAMTWLP